MTVQDSSSSALPGWYPNPYRPGTWLWWDGRQWHDPQQQQQRPPEPEITWFAPLTPLKAPAAWVAIGLVVFLGITNVLSTELPDAVAQLVSLGALGINVVGWPLAAWYSSRRWGTGNVVADLGLRPKWIDLPLGVLGAIAMTVALVIIGMITQALGLQEGSNLNGVKEQVTENPGQRTAMFLTLFVVAGIIAPLTEELLFRGLMLRGLLSKMPIWGAIAVQSVIFGFAHFTPSEGWGNVTMVLALGTVGFVLGVIAYATGRLWTGMVAHAVFNCFQLTMLWLTL